MSHHQSSPLSVTIKGGVAGLVGTAAITAAMQRGPQFMGEKLGISLETSDPPPEDVPEDPRAELAERVATGVLETGIGDETKQTASQAIHWSYGAMWGAVFGIVHSSLRIPLLVHGTLFGGLVAIVASTAVPAIGLVPAPTEQPKRISAMQLIYHLIFSWVVAIVFAILTARDD